MKRTNTARPVWVEHISGGRYPHPGWIPGRPADDLTAQRLRRSGRKVSLAADIPASLAHALDMLMDAFWQ